MRNRMIARTPDDQEATMPDEPKPIDDLTPDEVEQEADLRARLRDLAELRVAADEIEYVSRRPDDGRLYIRRNDGEIVYIAADIVDGYLATQPADASTLTSERDKLTGDMFARGKWDAFARLIDPASGGTQ
jgi:hypothetical protein